MRVLIGCERSGIVRDAFRARGHDAVSCDLEPTRAPGPHLQCDLREALTNEWDLAILHPPCTYLSVSGLHWNKRRPERQALTEAALDFVRELMAAPISRLALENPISCISTRIRPADQIIQPYQFGDDASKATCLWLKNLPPLEPTNRVPGRIIYYRGRRVERWANQTDSGQNRLPPSDERAELRSNTYPGIAAAMADQWGAAALPDQSDLFPLDTGP